MIRILIAVLALCMSAPLKAEPVATLSSEADMLHLPGGAAQMTIFFTDKGDLYDVTMLFTDNTGDVLRSGVRLASNQSHAITLSDAANGARTRYRVHRLGRLIGIHMSEQGQHSKLALR